MCTVTLLPDADGFRIGFNRDERRDRPPAEPPRAHALGRLRAWFPVDAPGGGSWIGVNESGLAVALLNRSMAPARAARGRRSRGLVVPLVLGTRSLDGARAVLQRIDASRFLPFRLIVVQGRQFFLATGDGATLALGAGRGLRPFMLASSSLGDERVRGPRGRLFERLVLRASDRRAAQAEFHAHRWTARPEISVVMHRPDAKTVSRTFADVRPGSIQLTYEAL